MAEFTLVCTIYNRKHMVYVAVYYIAFISWVLFVVTIEIFLYNHSHLDTVPYSCMNMHSGCVW